MATESVVIATSDDTESRLLSGVPVELAFLAACGPWTLGCEWPLEPGQSVYDSIGRLTWRVIEPATSIQLPALSPSSKPLPDWQLALFRAWRERASVKSSVELTALEAGLRQIHDDLDGSHQCAQSIEGQGHQHGDYWHAIMHRREPDYGNSQYWFRRVGRHAIYPQLAAEAERVATSFPNATLIKWLPRLLNGNAWNAMAYVDCVAEAANHSDKTFRRAIEELQYREMLLLFAQTHRDTLGG